MAKYTTTIQEYCQSVYLGFQLELNPNLNPVQVVANMDEDDYYNIVENYIFPSEWPFYNDIANDKEQFIKDFTDFFMYYEIGQSTMDQFRHVLKTWLRLDMSKYAQLYGSQLSGIGDVLNNTDVWRRIAGTTSGKTGTVRRAGSVTYGKTETRDNWNVSDGSVTNGRTDTNSIVPLGSTAAFNDLSKQTAGGTDRTAETIHNAGTVGLSGTDGDDHTDTYNTTDSQDLTEHRAGRENINVADAVEKYRALILDMNSLIFEDMKKYGLFMLVW